MLIKEKAIEIKTFYRSMTYDSKDKICAINHVKCIINELDSISNSRDIDLSDDIRYWKQVLTELNQM